MPAPNRPLLSHMRQDPPPIAECGHLFSGKAPNPVRIALHLNPAFTHRFAAVPYLPVRIIKGLNIRREECKWTIQSHAERPAG